MTDTTPRSDDPRRSEVAALRQLIAHYESVADQAIRNTGTTGDHDSQQIARAARSEVSALRRELRTVRLLGWDIPTDRT